MSETKTLYDADFVAWSKQQAEALRAAAVRRSTNQQLDWENLAEEIEDLGKSERRELGSRLSVVIEHLIKLDQYPARNPRKKWRQTISRERAEISRILELSPSLAREISGMVENEIRRTVPIAVRELNDRGELRRAMTVASMEYLELFSFSTDQVLGDWFPPESNGPSGRAARESKS